MLPAVAQDVFAEQCSIMGIREQAGNGRGGSSSDGSIAGAPGAEAALRLRGLSAGAGGRRRGDPRLSRRAGGHAHGRGQVGVLPGTRRGYGRFGAGSEPARVADGRPGARASGRRHTRRLPQFHAHARAAVHRAAPRAGRRLPDHVCGAGAAGRSAVPRIRAKGGHPARRRGRGALRVPVGPGFPPVVSDHRRLHRAAAEPSRRGGVHGHGHRARARRHRAPARPARPLRGGHGLRPPEPVLRRGAARSEAQDRAHRRLRVGACGRQRHRVLLHPQGHRQGARRAAGGGHPRRALPCGHVGG